MNFLCIAYHCLIHSITFQKIDFPCPLPSIPISRNRRHFHVEFHFYPICTTPNHGPSACLALNSPLFAFVCVYRRRWLTDIQNRLSWCPSSQFLEFRSYLGAAVSYGTNFSQRFVVRVTCGGRTAAPDPRGTGLFETGSGRDLFGP